MRKSRAGSLKGDIGCGALRMTLSISQLLFHKTWKSGASSFFRLHLQNCWDGDFSENRGLIDDDGTRFIAGSNAGLFFYIEYLAATEPE